MVGVARIVSEGEGYREAKRPRSRHRGEPWRPPAREGERAPIVVLSRGAGLTRAAVDDDRVARRERAREQQARERILDVARDGALERPRAEHRVVALVGQERARRGQKLDLELAVAQQLAQALELQVDDPVELAAQESMKDDDVVDAVQELGPEGLAQLVEHLLLE